MSGLATAIITGVTAFSATNIDDFVILLLFFAQVNASFNRRHIIIGQYVGFSALILASLPGFFGGSLLPRNYIGLLGLIPITIGLSGLLNQQEDTSMEVEAEIELNRDAIASFLSPQTYSVAAITLANGGDNIGVYVPLFASRDLATLVVILGVFLLLVGVWCYAAYKLTNQMAIASVWTRYGNTLVPFVLIGLGAFIILESNALSLLKLVASSLCLMILVKKDELSNEGVRN